MDSKIAFCEFCVVWAGEDGEVYRETDGGTDETNKVEEIKEKMKGLDADSEVRNDESSSGSSKGKGETKEGISTGRIPLPWELLQPVLRILGHCLLGPNKNKELYEAACVACRSLYARSLHDINSKAILATGSLLKLVKLNSKPMDKVDHTELTITDVITI